MAYDNQTLKAVFAKTDGKCHICHKRVCFKNYGLQGARGAWHVDDSLPRGKGGAYHFNNYLPAHIRCNLAKSTRCNRTVRSRYNHTRAPLSATRKEKLRRRNAAIGAGIGTLLFAATGPVGWLGTAASALIGHSLDPDA